MSITLCILSKSANYGIKSLIYQFTIFYNDRMPLKISLKSVLIYAVTGACMVFANSAIKGVPLSAGILVSALLCGMSIITVSIEFTLASIVCLDIIYSSINLFMAVFLALIAFLYRRSGRKIRYEAVLYIVIALAPYVAFAPWLAGDFIIKNVYALRSVAALITVIFGFFCFRCVYSLLFRIQRCRLKEDELISVSIVFAVCGAGVISLVGNTAYMCIAAGITVFAVRLARSPAAIIAAIVTALPCACIQLELTPITVFTVISAAALLFSGAGRFASGLATATLTALYLYYTKNFDCAVPLIVIYSLTLFIACFLPSLPKDSVMISLRRRLAVTDVLPETAVVRSRKRTGEKLYRISEVFREIECAFKALDDDVNENAARERIFRELKEKSCTNCEREKICARSNVYKGFQRLIDSGCAKGKVNLIDLPSEMSINCAHPADVLGRLNALLNEYRRYMTENENARSGRIMLAEQARGVAEVMKSCAVDLSRIYDFGGAAESVKKALSSHGICCPEVYIDGENGNELCATVIGKINVNAFEKIVSDTLQKKFVLKDKIVYDNQKCCLIFSAPSHFDAAFGVAYAIKSGETVSGDTHSVIRINEREFLMTLSDGMGSGEYARKVSEAAISLIEAFYRAEMPEDNILNTINKLLSFNRDERFTCIDIAAVNLDSGRADFVKIGSPAGIIMREGEIKVFESNSLPLGILDNLRPTVSSERLKDGDIIVFMSDGITSAFPSATDLYEFLQDFRPLNPQNLADSILAGALDKTEHKVLDDMTVLCTRIFENDK